MDKTAFEKLIVRLEAILVQQISHHEQLCQLMQRKREAMRQGDQVMMNSLCDLENEKVQAISELEKQRLAAVADLTLAVDPGAEKPMRMLDLAERLDEPARGRVLVLRGRLYQRMTAVKEESSIARRAAQSLVNHMQGLLQTLGALSSGTVTYGSRGVPASGGRVSTINVTA